MLPGICVHRQLIIRVGSATTTMQVVMEAVELDGGRTKHRAVTQETRICILCRFRQQNTLAKVKEGSLYQLNVNKVMKCHVSCMLQVTVDLFCIKQRPQSFPNLNQVLPSLTTVTKYAVTEHLTVQHQHFVT